MESQTSRDFTGFQGAPTRLLPTLRREAHFFTMGKGVCRQGRGHHAPTGVRSGGRPGPPIPGSSSLRVTILTSSWGDSVLSLPLSGKAWAALGARPGSHFSSSLWQSSSQGEHQQQNKVNGSTRRRKVRMIKSPYEASLRA